MCVYGGNLNIPDFVRCSTARHRHLLLFSCTEGADKPGQVIQTAGYPSICSLRAVCKSWVSQLAAAAFPSRVTWGKLLCSLHRHTRYEKGGHGMLLSLPKNGMLYKMAARNNSERGRCGTLNSHSLEMGGGASTWRSSVKHPLWLQPYSMEH